MKQPDVVGYHQAIPHLVPPGAVQGQHGERPLAHLPADFLQMQVHGMNIGTRQNKPSANTAIWTDGAEQIGRLVALIARGCGSAAAQSPDAGQAALLTNAGFILPPQLNWLALRGTGNDGGDKIGEVFLCASWASASAWG